MAKAVCSSRVSGSRAVSPHFENLHIEQKPRGCVLAAPGFAEYTHFPVWPSLAASAAVKLLAATPEDKGI